MNSNNDIAALTQLLNNLVPGKVPADKVDDVQQMLQKCWDAFEGSKESSMSPWKLDRVKGFEWHPPCLSFLIERHGATVLGSSRAEIHGWDVNLEKKTAVYSIAGHKQLRPNASKIDTRAIANDICEKITLGAPLTSSQAVVHDTDGRIRIKPALLLPSDGPKQTVTGRRKRLTADFKNQMELVGWNFVESKQGWLIFQKIPS